MKNITIFEDNLNKFNKDSYRPALFLDRDGVIIKDLDYISDPNEVTLEGGILELLFNAYIADWKVVVITNQSGISRGFFDWSDYEKVTRQMMKLLGKPTKISAIYANGFGPNDKDYNWRKPNPGMIIESATRLNINLNESILIGDRYSDLIAGLNAGVKFVYHVLTGNGRNEREKIILDASSPKRLKYNDYAKILFIESLFDLDDSIFIKKPLQDI